MVDWNDMRFLLALNDHKSMQRAAEALKTDATTVSRRVRRLGEDVGQTLVSRTSNGTWKASPLGERFIEVARTINTSLESLTQLEAQDVQGPISLSTFEFLARDVFIPNLSDLLSASPGIRLAFQTKDKAVSLAYGEVDMIINFSRPTEGRLVASRIGRIDMSIFRPKAHVSNSWIGFTKAYDDAPEMQLAYEHFRKPPEIRLDSFEAIRIASISTGFACVGPSCFASTLQQVDGAMTIKRDVWCAIHETRRHDKVLQTTREWARACFAKADECLGDHSSDDTPSDDAPPSFRQSA